MKHIAALFSCLFAATAAPALAQHHGAKPAQAEQSAMDKYLGKWEGSFSTDHSAPGVLHMNVARDTAWNITLDIVMDQPLASERVSDFKIDGNKVSWNHGLMGGTCKAAAVNDAGTLKGEGTCDQGAYTFTLVKK